MKRTLIPLAFVTSALALAPIVHAQNSFAGPATDADPFAVDPAKPGAKKNTPQNEITGVLSIRYETFSLDLVSAASIMRSDRLDAALYELILELVKNSKATQDSLTVLRCRAGQKGKSESIAEYIYPTEWGPAEIPQNLGIQITPPKSMDGSSAPAIPQTEKLSNAPRVEDIPLFTTPAHPTAFEHRNLGFTMEVEPQPQADPNTIELRIAPEHVDLAGLSKWGQGVSQLVTPEFETRRISTAIRAQAGVPRLLGTINRPSDSKIDAESAGRVSLVFVTVSHVRN